ncbi:unnamed protein product [Leptidea sinapis]|uniref:Uncharacterized protein n=1 Tax=Leptidea sinapis TaxID=189913 RepID=A0A5E4Q1G0_9NEOP|nr:unnamed protein product [Leptidea sinapis]
MNVISNTGKPGEPVKMKDEKELKPVSMRVRDAAESLLMLILEQSGGNIGGGWCRLDERWLSALGHGRLRHFAADSHTVLSLLEEPLANSQQPQPTLVVVIRSAWGRFAWSLSSRGSARCAGRGAGAACARPVPMSEPPSRAPPACRAPPAAPACAVLEAVLRQLNDPDAHVLFKLLEQQATLEQRAAQAHENIVPEEYVPPEPVTEFQTARMFLSHFGYLNISGDKKNAGSRLEELDGSAPGLGAALRRLDATGSRAPLTVHVFCVRAGQVQAAQVLANADTTPPAGFRAMLRGLGKPVSVAGHAGWTGHVASSYDARPHFDGRSSTHADASARAPTPALYNGREQVLYWSDSTDEIAFIVPSGREVNDAEVSDVDGSCLSNNRSLDKGSESCWDVSSGSALSYERSVSECEQTRARSSLSDKRALSLTDKQAAASFTHTADFTLHIEDISLDNIRGLINQAREVEDPDEVNLPLIMATPSWTTVILYFIGFVIISKKIYQWLKNKRMKPNPRASEEASEDAGGSCKLRFHLEGGGVTEAPSV